MSRPARRWLIAALLLLAVPAAGREPRTLRVRFPRFTLPPGSNSELCYLIRLPRRQPFDLTSWTITHHARGLGVRHFLVYLYTGQHLADLAADAGRIVESRACLDLGPADRDQRQLVFSGSSLRTRDGLPDGVALRLAPVPAAPGGPPDGIGLLLDANWVNGGSRPGRARTRIVMRRARRGTVKRIAMPLFDHSAELGLSVPPGTVRSTEDSTAALGAGRDAWRPAADACVVFITGHMHARGRLFAVDRLGADGSVQNPPDGFVNPLEPGRRHLFATPDFTDPGTLPFSPPQPLRAGEALHYACWHDNGVERATRLGCQETGRPVPGIAAGLPGGGPAKPCRVAGASSPDCPPADTAYPDRQFTGACVAANLVAGGTPDDEVCALAGVSFEAAPDGGCDLSGLPPLP